MQLAIQTKDAYQIACHFHMWYRQNSSTIMAKLYPLYPAVLWQIGEEGSEGGGREVEEERRRGKRREGERGKGREGRGERGGEKRMGRRGRKKRMERGGEGRSRREAEKRR